MLCLLPFLGALLLLGLGVLLLWRISAPSRGFILKWRSSIIGLFITAGGIAGLTCFHSGIGHSIGEGILVAGVVTCAVDPFLKGRLLKEVTKDIFPFILGYGLPKEICGRLEEIVNTTKLYRKDMIMDCCFSESGTDIRIDFETSYEVLNPTSDAITFYHYLAFEDAEQATLKTMTCSINGVESKYDEGEKPVMGYEQGVTKYCGKLTIKSDQKKYKFTSTYWQLYPDRGFHIQTFGSRIHHTPTIGFKLTVKEKPIDLEVSATLPEKPGNEDKPGEVWHYDQVFMPGDSVYIRWEKKSSGVTSSLQIPPTPPAI